MKLSLFDLHCDTPFEMLRQNQPLGKNALAVSLQKAECFERYVQVMAFWCNKTLSDKEGWIAFEKMYLNLLSDASVLDNWQTNLNKVVAIEQLTADASGKGSVTVNVERSASYAVVVTYLGGCETTVLTL